MSTQDENVTRDLAPRDPVVESASATTDHDHNRAGAAPVVAVVVCLVVLGMLCASVGGCVGSVAGGLARSYDPYYDGYDWDDGLDGWDPDDDYGYDWDGWDDASASSPLTLEDGLEAYVDGYDVSLDDLVSASDYAGVPAPVRDFAVALCSVDDDANDAVLSELRPALTEAQAGDTDAALADVADARAACEAAAKDAAALTVPDDASSPVRSLLGDAAEAVQERWARVARELDVLAGSAGDGTTLGDFDDACWDATYLVYGDGSDALLEALSRASE